MPPRIAHAVAQLIAWAALAAVLATWGWEAGKAARLSADVAPPSFVAPGQRPPPPPTTTPPVSTTPYPPLPPPQTAGPLTINYNATYHYDPYRVSFCLVVRVRPRDLSDLSVFVASLASGQYANLRVWLLGGELSDAAWTSVTDDVASLQSAYGRRFVYAHPAPFDKSTSHLPVPHRNLLLAEQLASTLSTASYGQLLSELDPACRDSAECFNPPLADLRAPLCDYIVHTTPSHIYNVQFAEALREATDDQADVVAYDFVSALEEEAGECVARREGGVDSQVFAHWRLNCIRLSAVAFRSAFVRSSGLRFIEAEELADAAQRPAEYYGSVFALRLLQRAHARIVHRVLVFEQKPPE